MKLRKLKREEYEKTRSLWERIFVEDTAEFLDYYYSVKTSENDIYVIEEDDDIHAMLQLNPYRMTIKEQTFDSHYIIAVATDENYRKRGYMGKLLKRAMEDMRANGEPFTFLMPAAEAIYYPHGFRYIYAQNQGTVMGKKVMNSNYSIVSADKKDCEKMAQFANRLLAGEYQVYAHRDAHYYERLLDEFGSEDGGMLLIKEGEELIGFFGYAKGEAYEIMEPLFLQGHEDAFRDAVFILTESDKPEVKCMAYGSRKKPMIMAKVLDIKKMFECMEAYEEIDVCLTVMDEPSGDSLGMFHISGKESIRVREIQEESMQKESFQKGIKAASLEPAEGYLSIYISIGDLTSIIFGYVHLDKMNLDDDLKNELRKLKPLDSVFLNEVV